MAEPTENNLSDYLQDISDFVSASAQQVADTDQEFMDEYYGEYPEKSANTALGILSAFPAVGGARLFNLIKNNSKALPNMVKDSDVIRPLIQLLGLGAGTLGSGIEMRERRENEADEMGIPFSEHPELQKKADGGELSNLNEIYNLLDSEYVTREGLNPNIDDKAAGLAKFFLPLNEDNSLNYGEAALAMTPFGFLTKAQKLARLRKAGGKGKQKEMPLSTSSDPSIGSGRRDLLFTRERMTDNALSDKAGTGVLMGPNEALKLSNAAKVLNPKKILVDQSSTLTKPKGLLSTKQARVLDDFPQLNKIEAKVMRSPSRADYDKYIDQISVDDLENSPLSLYELIELIKKSQ